MGCYSKKEAVPNDEEVKLTDKEDDDEKAACSLKELEREMNEIAEQMRQVNEINERNSEEEEIKHTKKY